MAVSSIKKPAMHELGMAHVSVNRNLNEFYQVVLRRYGLTTIEWLILGAVADASVDGTGIRVTDLANVFSVKSTYMTTTLNALRERDFIETRFDATDARVRLAHITAKGTKQVSSIEHHMQKEISHLLGGAMSGDEFEKYATVIKKLSRIL
jgi:DNA-binding MarR family transcriptional regulator